jgi:Lipopolysaccharide kinase (Kdo/WaaP) family
MGLTSLCKYKAISDLTCCPCITISIAGPYISFGGAIFVDAFVTESFTDFIYLGGTKEKLVSLSRIFAAVARGIATLKKFYRDLKSSPASGVPVHRLFPQPTYLPNKPRPSPTLVFSSRFEYEGWEEGNYRRSLFKATYDEGTVLVKFCESYHGDAHQKLAEAEYAPKLFFCEKIQGGMTMVIMDFVKCRDAHHHFLGEDLPDYLVKEVTAAVKLLHDVDLVFGDLRRPNILIQQKDNKLSMQLIDFEWVGIAGQARYPPYLNDSGQIVWATGVCPYGIMKKEHDLGMIELLNSLPKVKF